MPTTLCMCVCNHVFTQALQTRIKVQFRLHVEHQFSRQQGKASQNIPKEQILHGSRFCQRSQPSFLTTTRTVNTQHNELISFALFKQHDGAGKVTWGEKKLYKTHTQPEMLLLFSCVTWARRLKIFWV